MPCNSTEEAVSFLDEHYKYVSDDDLVQLKRIVSRFDNTDHDDFDILSEVKAQMKVVRDLRKKISMETSPTRDVKDLVASSTQLFSMLTKMQSEINNQHRLKQIEEAVLEAIRLQDQVTQDRFFQKLEELLP